MMAERERERALAAMRSASRQFHVAAICISCHPFIEFTGLINQYIEACEMAHKAGIDFTECNKHSGQALPMADHMTRYVNEKLECIFTGQIVMGVSK